MINRIPNHYSLERPANGVRSTGAVDRSAAEDAVGGGTSLSNRLLTAAANSVGTHPVISLSVAFATGILLGKLVKR